MTTEMKKKILDKVGLGLVCMAIFPPAILLTYPILVALKGYEDTLVDEVEEYTEEEWNPTM